jgi:hypothetical protein
MHEDGTQTDGWRQGVENESGRSDAVFRRALDAIRRDGIALRGSQIADEFRFSGLERWKGTLKRYTKRTLTVLTDRFPAISGVAMLLLKNIG